MACAEQVKQCWWQYGFDENVQRAAANQAGIVLGILIEVESQGTRLLRLHHVAGSLPDLGFDAAAADRSYDRAVVAHQHLGRFERRNRAAHVDNSGDSSPAAFLAQLYNFLVNVHPGLIIGVCGGQVKPSITTQRGSTP